MANITLFEQVTDQPQIKSCWPEEIGTDEIQDWDTFSIVLYSPEAGDDIRKWKDVEAVLANAGYVLCKINQYNKE